MKPAQLDALRRDLAALRLDETLDPNATAKLLKTMKSVIGFKLKGGQVPLGASKIGGRPHADARFVWPTAKNVWNENAIEPMAFVAQLNLGQLARYDSTRTLPSSGLILFFALPGEYDPMSWRSSVSVPRGRALAEVAPPRGLASAGGVFSEKALEPYETVAFPDPNGGFLSFDSDNEVKINRLLKTHQAATADLDSLLERPAFSRKAKGYSPKKDVILLRAFGEFFKSKGESLWHENELLFVIGREALAAGDLGEARFTVGEST